MDVPFTDITLIDPKSVTSFIVALAPTSWAASALTKALRDFLSQRSAQMQPLPAGAPASGSSVQTLTGEPATTPATAPPGLAAGSGWVLGAALCYLCLLVLVSAYPQLRQPDPWRNTVIASLVCAAVFAALWAVACWRMPGRLPAWVVAIMPRRTWGRVAMSLVGLLAVGAVLAAAFAGKEPRETTVLVAVFDKKDGIHSGFTTEADSLPDGARAKLIDRDAISDPESAERQRKIAHADAVLFGHLTGDRDLNAYDAEGALLPSTLLNGQSTRTFSRSVLLQSLTMAALVDLYSGNGSRTEQGFLRLHTMLGSQLRKDDDSTEAKHYARDLARFAYRSSCGRTPPTRLDGIPTCGIDDPKERTARLEANADQLKEEVARRQPDPTSALLVAYGERLIGLRRWFEAEAAFNEAIKVDTGNRFPVYGRAYYGLAVVFAYSDRLSQACAMAGEYERWLKEFSFKMERAEAMNVEGIKQRCGNAGQSTISPVRGASARRHAAGVVLVGRRRARGRCTDHRRRGRRLCAGAAAVELPGDPTSRSSGGAARTGPLPAQHPAQ